MNKLGCAWGSVAVGGGLLPQPICSDDQAGETNLSRGAVERAPLIDAEHDIASASADDAEQRSHN